MKTNKNTKCNLIDEARREVAKFMGVPMRVVKIVFDEFGPMVEVDGESMCLDCFNLKGMAI